MKKSTKAAIATGAAAVLLLGGAGTLAFWTATDDVDGGTIGAGHMSISAPDCGAGWTYDSGEDLNGAAFTPGSDVLVPGDAITETCETTFSAEGEHLRATLTATPGAGSDELFVAAAPNNLILTGGSSLEYSSDAGATWDPVPGTGLTEANNGDLVRIAITVTFNPLADDEVATMDVDSTLDAITITAEQIHS